MGFDIKKSIDLRGVSCPMNFVKTKAALTEIKANELLEVVLDEGDAMLNVPRSVKEEGHKIVNVENIDTFFKIIIRKSDI
ncbi:MAG: sulfurtransferase TusA family protein [Elusimicrobia bacterium]|nr:sulfurtransferase TusA family protein [Elusimicrobiota bacterium]